jgi:hypothetical protein
MRLTITIGFATLAIGAALSPVPASAQYWGYNGNGGVIALPAPHHRTHHGRLYNRNSVSPGAYNRDLPPGGATPGNFSPQ